MPPAARLQSGAAPVSQAWAGPQSPCLPPGLWFRSPQAAAQHCPAPQHCPHFAPPTAQGQEEAAQEGAPHLGGVRSRRSQRNSPAPRMAWGGVWVGLLARPAHPHRLTCCAHFAAAQERGAVVQPQGQLLREAAPSPSPSWRVPGLPWKHRPAPARCPSLPSGCACVFPAPPETGGTAGHCLHQFGNKSQCPAVSLTMLPSMWLLGSPLGTQTHVTNPSPTSPHPGSEPTPQGPEALNEPLSAHPASHTPPATSQAQDPRGLSSAHLSSAGLDTPPKPL